MKTIFHILNKCLLIILAIQMLNLSFNNLNNFFSDQPSNSISYHNQIDSAYEYITEHLFGWDNYVPENKSRTDHQANHLHKTANTCLYLSEATAMLKRQHGIDGKVYPLTITGTRDGYKMEVTPPPPKA